MTELRHIPLHSALTRPQLFAGGEREPMLFLILICCTLAFVGLTWVTALVAASLWMFGAFALRLMGKADPILIKLYQRHVAYPPYLPPHARPWSSRRIIKSRKA